MVKDVMTGVYVKDNENIEFNFKTELTALEKAEFVAGVSNALVGNNYLSVLRDMFFDYYIVNIFTDVKINTNQADETAGLIDEIESFLDETNVVDIVKANIDVELINELDKAVNENIEYRTGIHKSELNNALTSLINMVEDKLKDVDLGSMVEIIESFGGITGEFTPENIVNAYMKTDVAKQNIEELNESKVKRAEFAEEVSEIININKSKGSKK